MTKMLYYEDPYLAEFNAAVYEIKKEGDRFAVVLDRTCFYPSGGGQSCDLGTLNEVAVVEVVEKEGKIIHYLEKDLTDKKVKGRIDFKRRIDHMQQHHGQHILSGAFLKVATVNTVSFHLGGKVCSIDLDRNNISKLEVEQAQEIANQIVFENRSVSAQMVNKQELAKLPVRRMFEDLPDPVRLISIDSFDLQPCSGTHPRRTGEVGSIVILNFERQKDLTRIYFVCGGRAVKTLYNYSMKLGMLSSKLSSDVENILGTVENRLQAESKLRKSLYEAQKNITKYIAREIISSATEFRGHKILTAQFQEKDLDFIKLVAHELANEDHIIACLASGGYFVLCSNAGVKLDLKTVLNQLKERFSVKGGGQTHFIQGGLEPSDTATFLEACKKVIEGQLKT